MKTENNQSGVVVHRCNLSTQKAGLKLMIILLQPSESIYHN